MLYRDRLLLLLLTAALVPVGRILFLLTMRQPVRATSLSHDYCGMQRARDEDFRVIARHDSFLDSDDIPFRRVLMRVRYEWNGEELRADVPTCVRKGNLPPFRLLVW